MTEIRVDTDIPAGNARILGVTGETIRLTPDVRDTLEPWFYWHVRVRGCAGRTLRFVFDGPHTLTVRGAAVSADAGWTWQWIPRYDPARWEFAHACGAADELHFSLAMPYTRRNLDRWLAGHQGNAALVTDTLCRSRGGADVPWLRIGRQDGREDTQILLTCRHHCCEMMASYELEGLLDAVLADDDLGRALRDRCCFHVVPMVDYDGVQAGDQGKRRDPHDHGADYGETRLYPETAAIRHLVTDRLDERLRMTLDLHCPWVRNEWNEHIYIVGSDRPDNAARQRALSAAIERANAGGALPFRAEGYLPYGQAWNVRTSPTPRKGCSRWVAETRPDATVATIEFPYADVDGTAVTAEAARDFGAAVARAMADHLLG